MKQFAVAATVVLTLAGVSACEVPVEEASSKTVEQKAGKQKQGKPQQKAAKQGQPQQESQPHLTVGQENALRSGQDYLDMMAFSKQGLVSQLSGPGGEGYSKADAMFAANNVDADWNAQAVKSAQDYMDIMAFSRTGLIQQLTGPGGEGFTKQQATQAVDKVMR